MTSKNLSDTKVDGLNKAQLQAKAKIEIGLRELRKQCKQLSKNELITTLLRQLEAYSELQAACRQLMDENKELKLITTPSTQNLKGQNENSSNPA